LLINNSPAIDDLTRQVGQREDTDHYTIEEFITDKSMMTSERAVEEMAYEREPGDSDIEIALDGE